jgi:hypothetical protein
MFIITPYFFSYDKARGDFYSISRKYVQCQGVLNITLYIQGIWGVKIVVTFLRKTLVIGHIVFESISVPKQCFGKLLMIFVCLFLSVFLSFFSFFLSVYTYKFHYRL